MSCFVETREIGYLFARRMPGEMRRYSPMEMQWNCRGSGTEYAAWYIPGAWLRLLDEECCLDRAE